MIQNRSFNDTQSITVLFTVWPVESHVRPFLALANALKSRGHRAVFYTEPSAPWRAELADFPCFPFREVRTTRIEEILRKLSGGMAGWMESRMLWKEFLLDSIPGQTADLRPIIANCRPDVIVTDITMWSPFLILREILNIPVVPFAHTAHCILPGPEGPLVGLSMPRPKSKPLRHLSSRIGAQLLELFSRGLRRQANALRAQYSLPPIPGTMTEFSGTAPLYLVPTSPEFDYRRKDLPNSVRYVGACFERRHAPSRNTPQTVSPESARVLVDSGLPYARPDFAERAVAEISALGLAHEKGNAYTLTSSLRSASVVVSNANSPMVLAALDHGVPIVAIPDSLESAENGWRIRDFGCGIRLSPNRLREGRIREAVSTILRVGSYRDKACELAASFSAHGGPVQASKLLVELALSHRWQSKSA